MKSFNFKMALLTCLLFTSCSLFVKTSHFKKECIDVIDQELINNGWEKSENKNIIEYKKGANIMPTLDYDDEGLEVQILIEKSPNGFIMEVGNYGMYPELKLMEQRFKRISDKLISLMEESKCTNQVKVDSLKQSSNALGEIFPE